VRTDVDLTVVVPWLEGGGAQAALARIMARLPEVRSRLVVAFEGSRNHRPVQDLFDNTVELGCPRSPAGAWRASRRLRPYLGQTQRVYSLTRASSVVLGLHPAPKSLPPLALTFHMLPSSDRQQLTGRAEELVLRRVTKAAVLVTSPSQRAVRELVDSRLAPPERTVYVPNLLKDPPATPPAPAGTGSPLRVLCAGRLEHQKGFDQLPWWFGETAYPVHVRIVGDGSQRVALAEAAADSTTPHQRFEVLGHVEDLTPHLDWSDTIFMPSRDELNPMLVWEAWQRGRPVVATDLPAFRDLAARGPIAVVDSPVELSRALHRLGQDPEGAYARCRAAVDGLADQDDHLLSFLRGAA
jgi:glycosyltransferase involved in cell wall biosynthesis